MALQPVMIADSVDYIEWKTGKRNDGIFFSGLTFNSKLSSGIAILISNVLLGFVSYTEVIDVLAKQIKQATDAGQTLTLNFAAEYPEITIMMFVLITVVPALGCILQALPMHGYEITDSKLAEIREENAERRRRLGETSAREEVDKLTTDGSCGVEKPPFAKTRAKPTLPPEKTPHRTTKLFPTELRKQAMSKIFLRTTNDHLRTQTKKRRVSASLFFCSDLRRLD